MRSRRFYLTQVTKLVCQVLMYLLVFAAFFFMLSITNPALLNASRTAATTMATFVLAMMVLTIVYGGYNIGVKKMRSVFASLSLATFLTDVVSYVILQIMNVNPQNPEANDHLILWGEDLALLAGAFVLQIGLIYLFVSVGYAIYFRINPPEKCVIITSSQELAEHVAVKMATFRQRYALNEVVHYDCPDIKATIMAHDAVFLAGIPDTEEANLEAFCYKHNKTMYLQAELEDVIVSTAEQSVLDDTPFLCIHHVEPTLVQMFVKRAADILISVIGLILTSPVMLATAAAIRLEGDGPVFFRQQRATINGNVFKIIKFRTMYTSDRDEEAPTSAHENDSRITPVGRLLRRYRLDELPQLWNVLKGDMSIVGPRPEMLENVDKYTREVPEFRYRQQMKAGLTGLAQIEGKYNTTPKDKAILDLMYIENFTLAYDCKLMLRTLTVFFRRDSTEGFCDKHVPCPKMRVVAKQAVKGSKESGKAAKKDDKEPLRAAL